MARQVLIVGSLQTLPGDYLGIGVNSGDFELREKWKDMSMSDVKQLFKNKRATFVGADYSIDAQIVDVQVTTSLVDFKNVFIKVKLNSRTGKIKELDEVEVDL